MGYLAVVERGETGVRIMGAGIFRERGIIGLGETDRAICAGNGTSVKMGGTADTDTMIGTGNVRGRSGSRSWQSRLDKRTTGTIIRLA
jgi:hypothetical protein